MCYVNNFFNIIFKDVHAFIFCLQIFIMGLHFVANHSSGKEPKSF